jgi:hypothetical protein
MMEEWPLKKYKELLETYDRSRMISYGSPDQFQYRQNQLLQALAEFILEHYYKCQEEEEKNNV